MCKTKKIFIFFLLLTACDPEDVSKQPPYSDYAGKSLRVISYDYLAIWNDGIYHDNPFSDNYFVSACTKQDYEMNSLSRKGGDSRYFKEVAILPRGAIFHVDKVKHWTRRGLLGGRESTDAIARYTLPNGEEIKFIISPSWIEFHDYTLCPTLPVAGLFEVVK